MAEGPPGNARATHLGQDFRDPECIPRGCCVDRRRGPAASIRRSILFLLAEWLSAVQEEPTLHLDVLEALCRNVLSSPALLGGEVQYTKILQLAMTLSVFSLNDHGVDGAAGPNFDGDRCGASHNNSCLTVSA